MEQKQVSSSPPRSDQDDEITAVWDRSLPGGDLPPDTVRPLIEPLDLTAVVQRSQPVPGENVKEKLVRALMTIAVEHAGAKRGLLILPRGEWQWIEAEAVATGDTLEVRLLQERVTPAHLPQSVLHHVMRTQDSVLLDDASAPSQFAEDEYIHANHARSIFCLPLVKQATLIGVLYLENNLTPSAFTPRRVAALNLLVSHAAISLETAHYYTDLQRAEESARQHERELRRAVDTIPGLVWTAQPDGYCDFLNQRWREYTGLTLEEAKGWGWKAAVCAQDLDGLMAVWRAVLASGKPGEMEARLRRFDGEYRWFLFRSVPWYDERGHLLKWYGTITDIQDRKWAEALLAGENRILEMIARGEPLAPILDAVCRLVEKMSGGCLCSILLLDSDGNRLRHGAAPSLPSSYTEAIDGRAIGPGWGPCGTAAYRREPVIVSDVNTDSLCADYRELAIAHGLRACWSTPIFSSEGKVLGTFAIYSREPGSPTPQHQTIIRQITHLAAVAIERKRTEEALRGSERNLRLIVDSIPGFIATMSPTGEVESVNQRILDYLGMSLEEIREWPRVVHEDDREATINTWKRSVETGEPYDIQHRIRRADGVYRWFHVRGLALRDPQGHVLRWYALVTDIDDQKQAEGELRRSETYLAEAQKLSLTGNFGWRVASGELIWSAETFCILGYDRSLKPTLELVFKRVHPEDVHLVQQMVDRASRDGTDLDFEHRLLMPEGSVKHLHVVAREVRDSSGGLEFVGAVSDVTAAKKAEERIRQDERESRQIVEAIPGLILVLTPNGSPLYANERLLDYTGLSLDAVQAGNFRERVFHPSDVERLRDERREALARGVPFELEQRARRKDGQYRWFLTRFNPLRDEQGHVIRWYATGTDIDDRKRAEERVRRENLALREEIDKTSMFEEIVGAAPVLRTVLARVAKVAPTDSTVLITGETGTGKELVARAIHKRSPRASHAFVSVNCAAVPAALIASELFGHEKGAFTGATQRRLGRFELAEGGTLFLDEIGELPAETQVTLLRVLQEREFERVGGRQAIRADVRVIAAANRDVQAAIAAGNFRSDLFYRLNVFPIEMPPLRERQEDIPLLVEYFVDRYAKKAGKKFRGVNRKTLELLQSYPWPGNIRELQNVIERSVIVCETETFLVDESWLSKQALSPPLASQALTKRCVTQEKEMIEAALAETKGRVSGPSGASAKLGLPPSTLESKIRSLKINKHRFKTF